MGLRGGRRARALAAGSEPVFFFVVEKGRGDVREKGENRQAQSLKHLCNELPRKRRGGEGKRPES